MESPVLKQAVEPENDLKNFIVEHVGNKLNPENQEVTVEMVISVMAEEFPEFVLALAEENWIRGYQQGLDDVEVGKKLAENEQQD
jgi:glucan biosynthesis protein